MTNTWKDLIQSQNEMAFQKVMRTPLVDNALFIWVLTLCCGSPTFQGHCAVTDSWPGHHTWYWTTEMWGEILIFWIRD